LSPELPLEIWKDRINNEVKDLKTLNVLEKDSIIKKENAVELIINIESLGFIKKLGSEEDDLKPALNHRVFLKLNRSFPYPGGIDFLWYSEIFHPNIHPVEISNSDETGTGYICLNVLKKWSKLSDLKNTVNALNKLVENPNPSDPLNYDICLEAAKFFKENNMNDLRKKFKVKDPEKKSEDDGDDIIIID
jgi:ubiquitin-protein ligase